MRIAILFILLLNVGCRAGEDRPPAESDSTIVLVCHGVSSTITYDSSVGLMHEYSASLLDSASLLEEGKDVSYLIEIGGKPLQRYLKYYDYSQKSLAPSTCTSFHECLVGVGADQIVESGKSFRSDGSVWEDVFTSINRRTGEMKKVTRMPGMTKVVEASCELGALPEATPQKF